MLRSLVENGDGENERDAVEVIASRLERQEHLDTLYGMLGGFIELARHVDQAQSAAAVDELLWCGPHSLANFVQLLEDTADEVLSPIRRWVLYTEAQQLIARPTSVRATDGVAERLYELCQRLRECCRRIEESTVLRDIDRAHIDDTTPLFEWFRRQLGLEFERMWEADE